MKKVIIYILAMMCCLAMCVEGNSQTLEFIFSAPEATMTASFNNARAFTRNHGGVERTLMSGYLYVYVTPANMAQFRAIAPRRLIRTYDSITTPTSALRRKLNKVMTLSSGKLTRITFHLIDDSTGLPDNTDSLFCPGDHDDMTIAWPCASNWRVNAATGQYHGRVMLGSQAAKIDIDNTAGGGFRRWEATIIHEVSHTQMLRDMDGVNKWDNRAALRIDGIAISYGGDEGHWDIELQADEQQPMDEGLGSFWGLEYNPPMEAELDDFLNLKSERFGLGSRSFLTGLPDMWNAPHRVFCNGIPCIQAAGDTLHVTLNTDITSPDGGYQLRLYKWMDVPGTYVFYNELMSQGYFYLYHRYAFASRDTAFNKIFNAVKTLCVTANQRHRYPAHAANMFANSMEAYARSAAGQRDAGNNTLVSSMFAYALYDILTHFGQSEDELRRNFNINSATTIPYTPKPLAFTNYWAHRNQVRQIACPFLGGNSCNRGASGNIDIHRAVSAVRDYFKDSSRILR